MRVSDRHDRLGVREIERATDFWSAGDDATRRHRFIGTAQVGQMLPNNGHRMIDSTRARMAVSSVAQPL